MTRCVVRRVERDVALEHDRIRIGPRRQRRDTRIEVIGAERRSGSACRQHGGQRQRQCMLSLRFH